MTTLPISQNQVQSEKLKQLICKEIERAGGYITFAQFMELSLYTPTLGYYSTHIPKFGREGDFITAPEMSTLFAQCAARQFQQILTGLGTGDILEIGAGSGIFARDILIELEKKNSLPRHYFILEKSVALRQAQQQLLQTACPHLVSRVEWLEKLPNKKVEGIIFANEVMDAMSVHLFQVKNQKIMERCVSWQDDQFVWSPQAPTLPALTEHVKLLQESYHLPEDYESEINLNLSVWIRSLARVLTRGAILLVDYGYGRREFYHPDRTHGTLMCFYQHQPYSNPLQQVGFQDITAHVDFTTVVESAVDAGLQLAGYTTQASFLLGCGLTDIAERAGLSGKALYLQNQVIKRLTLPSEMGEVVKVIGFNKSIELSWSGFALYDRRHDL